MTVDISFGKIERHEEDGEAYDWCVWPDEPQENDGCSPEHTIFAGKPRRSFGQSGFSEWIRRIPQAHVIADVCYRDDHCFTKVDDGVLALINTLPDKGQPIDRDRARWFKYWAKRARETFGDEAVIFFW